MAGNLVGWFLGASSMRLDEVGEGNIQRHGAWWNSVWAASCRPSYLLTAYDGAIGELSDAQEAKLGTWGVYEVAASACANRSWQPCVRHRGLRTWANQKDKPFTTSHLQPWVGTAWSLKKLL